MLMTVVAIAFYSFVMAVTEDNKWILRTINSNARAKASRSQIYKGFKEFIDLHSDAKEFSD